MRKILLVALPVVAIMASCAKQPEACFQLNPNRDVKENEEVSFNATCSVDADNFSWQFGDGTSAEGPTVTHKYAQEGSYDVKLRVTTDGQSDETSSTITVTK